MFSYRIPHQLLCRLEEWAIFNFLVILRLFFRFCHICVILLLLSEMNRVNVNVNVNLYCAKGMVHLKFVSELALILDLLHKKALC